MFSFHKVKHVSDYHFEAVETLTINEVDRLACKFWGQSEHPRHYACPEGWGMVNWFDMLGHAIENVQYQKWKVSSKGFVSWNDVKGWILMNACDFKTIDITKLSVDNLKPFFDFCDYLHENNIEPQAHGW